MKNSTIYLIQGGGQRVRQNTQMGLKTTYQVKQNSDWPAKSQATGCDSFTHAMWSTDLESLQRWANEWAGEEIELHEAEMEQNY